MLIEGKRDIVIHGCGWQTRVASRSLQPGSLSASQNKAAAASSQANQFNAVIAIDSSHHIELRSFAVEAAPNEVGILIDGTETLISKQTSRTGDAAKNPVAKAVATDRLGGVVDTTIEDMIITASTLPAILAKRAQLLRIANNRIATANVRSLWSAVYVSGAEIHVERNWVGVQSETSLTEWLPATVADDLSSDAKATAGTTVKEATLAAATVKGATLAAAARASLVAEHPGGIQIAGPSQDVFVVENEIEGGSRNGITLGSFEILDARGDNANRTVGLLLVEENPCSTTGTLLTPGTNPDPQGGTVVSGEGLLRIQIDRNRICDMGLCGIGPAGFFNLIETLEVITIEDLSISANTISNTLLRTTAPVEQNSSIVGYGAICVPDVQNLKIHDNSLTNFGARPGLDVCGIFVLHGEMVEIARNHVLETRDWTDSSTDITDSASGMRGGILVALVTPPAFSNTSIASLWSYNESVSTTIYEPGLPALRVEQNVVRVPLSESLAVLGFGPFAISDNHFTCGGTVSGAGTEIAQTVLIVNLGTALEVASAAGKPSEVYRMRAESHSTLESSILAGSSSGAVLFTNNICQLETCVDQQSSFASVAIVSPDHLIFANNHCWLDAPGGVIVDAFLLAGSLQVTSNRLQEAPQSVSLSGWTAGALNITSQNISTYCLFAEGYMLVNNNNLAIVGTDLCQQLLGQVASTAGMQSGSST